MFINKNSVLQFNIISDYTHTRYSCYVNVSIQFNKLHLLLALSLIILLLNNDCNNICNKNGVSKVSYTYKYLRTNM